jgi:hypothetical protein
MSRASLSRINQYPCFAIAFSGVQFGHSCDGSKMMQLMSDLSWAFSLPLIAAIAL